MIQFHCNHFKNKYFLVFSILFLTHQLFEKIFRMPNKWLDSYLDPILFMPILLHLILWEKWVLFKKPLNKVLSGIEVFIWWLAISIITEYYFPKLNAGFTADFLDVVLYGAGSLFFFFMMNHSKEKALSKLSQKEKEELLNSTHIFT